MPSLLTQAIGAFAVVLGIAWVIWPMRMIELQYRVLYFWTDDPDLSNVNETVARVGGVILAALGVALLAGLLG